MAYHAGTTGSRQANQDIRGPTQGGPFVRALAQIFGFGSRPVMPLPDGGGEWSRTAQEGEPDPSKTTPRTRLELYKQYDTMDSFDLAQAILDIYAEESTQPDYDTEQSVWIEADDAEVKKELEHLLERLQIEDNILAIARNMAKYGDHFRRLVYADGRGVEGWLPVNPSTVGRVEDKLGRLIGFQQEQKQFRSSVLGSQETGEGRPTSWPWDYVHFRLLGKDEGSTYGTSLLSPMYRPFRQLVLTEDALLSFRLRRVPERNAIFVDVGYLSDEEAAQYVNNWRKAFSKNEFVDPTSNPRAYEKQWNPMTPFQDMFIPTRQGMNQNIRIDNMKGSGNMDRVYDLDYFVNKMIGVSRIPKAYLGFEEDINSKATLIQQDVRFARTAKRIRRALLCGIRTVCMIHLALRDTERGKTNKLSDKKFVVQMSPISYLDEVERAELLKVRYEIIQQSTRFVRDLEIDPSVWATYLLSNYAKLPDELVNKLTQNADNESVMDRFYRYARANSLSEAEIQEWREDPEAIERAFGGSLTPTDDLSEEDRQRIADSVEGSPELRGLLQNIAQLFEGGVNMDSQIRAQTDYSVMFPDIGDDSGGASQTLTEDAGSNVLSDDTDEDGERRQLIEDLRMLRSRVRNHSRARGKHD